MTYDDLSVLFGNLMDNAVESAEKTVNPFIELNVFQKENNNMTIITLIDSCRVNPIDKMAIFYQLKTESTVSWIRYA